MLSKGHHDASFTLTAKPGTDNIRNKTIYKHPSEIHMQKHSASRANGAYKQ